VDAGHYVLVKRLSAKEEPRRVVAAVYDPAVAPDEAAPLLRTSQGRQLHAGRGGSFPRPFHRRQRRQGPRRPGACGGAGNGDPQGGLPGLDLVPILQINGLDSLPIDEGAVVAVEVQEPGQRRIEFEQEVGAREVRVGQLASETRTNWFRRQRWSPPFSTFALGLCAVGRRPRARMGALEHRCRGPR